MLSCPICHCILHSELQSYMCTNNHCFDLSRDGYLNLNHGPQTSQLTGDTQEMLSSRREFFSQGHYDFLRNAISAQSPVAEVIDCGEEFAVSNVVDVGSGEGSFLASLCQHLRSYGPDARVHGYGVDISKYAARMAAKSFKEQLFVVADITKRLPFLTASADVLLNVCAPKNFAEFSRILRPPGFAVIVMPTTSHAHELRRYMNLLSIDEDKERVIIERATKFELIDRLVVEDRSTLTRDGVKRFLQMTPNYWHQPNLSERIQSSVPEKVIVTFSFSILTMRLRADAV